MNEPTVLTSSLDVTIRIPVDLSSDLDSPDAPPLMSEHTITLSIESPNPPLTLVNAIGATLDTAIRTVYEQPRGSHVEPFRQVTIIETTDSGAKLIEQGAADAVLFIPPGTKLFIPPGTKIADTDPIPKDASL